MVATRHSPLTGIFLIRRYKMAKPIITVTDRHSPLTGIFLIRRILQWNGQLLQQLVTVP